VIALVSSQLCASWLRLAPLGTVRQERKVRPMTFAACYARCSAAPAASKTNLSCSKNRGWLSIASLLLLCWSWLSLHVLAAIPSITLAGSRCAGCRQTPVARVRIMVRQATYVFAGSFCLLSTRHSCLFAPMRGAGVDLDALLRGMRAAAAAASGKLQPSGSRSSKIWRRRETLSLTLFTGCFILARLRSWRSVWLLGADLSAACQCFKSAAAQVSSALARAHHRLNLSI
jgi:hypothetical protein